MDKFDGLLATARTAYARGDWPAAYRWLSQTRELAELEKGRLESPGQSRVVARPGQGMLWAIRGRLPPVPGRRRCIRCRHEGLAPGAVVVHPWRCGHRVIEGKRGLDTFASTNLDFILLRKGITTIVLGGFLTNCCVKSTMRSGHENGYQIFTLSDCLAATSIEERDNAIAYDYPMFSAPMTAELFSSQLS